MGLLTKKIIIQNFICLLVCINTGCIHLIYYKYDFVMINELFDELSIISRWLYTVSTWKSKLKRVTPRNTCRNLSLWILLCKLKRHPVVVCALFIFLKYVKLIYPSLGLVLSNVLCRYFPLLQGGGGGGSVSICCLKGGVSFCTSCMYDPVFRFGWGDLSHAGFAGTVKGFRRGRITGMRLSWHFIGGWVLGGCQLHWLFDQTYLPWPWLG